MFEAITHLIERKPKTGTNPPEAWNAPEGEPQFEAKAPDEQYGFYSKTIHWPVLAGQTPEPTRVEVVGSFTDWATVPLVYDRPSQSWHLTLNHVRGNHTHRYVILVDGIPTYDKTCDGVAPPEGPQEAKWQIQTPRGPRVMLAFSETR